MSFVIRSANGQRSLTKITNRDPSGALRDELIEALRGLTIKFEVKIADVVLPSETNEQATQASKEAEATFANRAGDILTELKTKLVSEQQQVSQNQGEPTRGQPRPISTAGAAPATSTAASSIITTIGKTKPTRMETGQPKDAFFDGPKREPKVKEEVAPKSTPKSELGEEKLNRLLDARSKPSKAPSKPETLVKGSLKIGTMTKTCCICIDETKQPPVPYISYDSKRLAHITSFINNMATSIESKPPVDSVDMGDIVFAKSKDDNGWYRSIVERVGAEDIDVYFFDWGLTETLDLSRIRRLAVLELGLSSNPAAALKVRINNPSGPLVDKFLECDSLFDISVDSYDEFDDTYSITILGLSGDV